MLETILSEIENSLATIAHRRGWDELASFSNRVRGIGSEEDVVLVAAPRGVDASAFVDWIQASGSASKPRPVCFEDLVAAPWPILHARRVVGLFEAGRLIEVKEAEIINRFFFARPAGSYAFVLQRAEILQTPEDVDSMRRIAWRMLVSPDHGPWRQQELSRYGVYLWSSCAVSAAVEDIVSRDRAAMRDWFSRKESDLDALRRTGALYILEQTRQRLEACATGPAGKPQTLHGETWQRARAMLADLEKRLKSRWDADIRLLAREVAADIERVKDQSLVSSDALDSLRRVIGEGPGGDAARGQLADFIRKRMNQTNEMISAKVRERLETVWKEMQSLVTGSDWSSINLWTAERGEKVSYPEELGKASMGGVTEREFSSIPQRIAAYKPITDFDSAAMLFPSAVGGLLGGASGWILAELLDLFFKLHILRALAGGAGAIAGVLGGVWIAERARSAAEFESAARRCLSESLLQMRDAASAAVLKLRQSPEFEEWIGRISKLSVRIAATAETGESSIARGRDAEDLRVVERAIERISADDTARK